MKRYIIAALMVLFAASAHAQNAPTETCQDAYVDTIHKAAVSKDTDALHKAYETTDIVKMSKASASDLDAAFLARSSCQEVDHITQGILTLWKPLNQVLAEDTIAQQEQQGQNLVNGANAQIYSKHKAEILQGLQSLRDYLKATETSFSGSTLPACQDAGGNASTIDLACNPVPYFKRIIDLRLNRLGWPTKDSASADYDWLIDQFQNGPPDMQAKVVDFAQINVTEIQGEDFSARIAQAHAKAQAADNQQQAVAAYKGRLAHDATVTGNFTSIGDRFVASVENMAGSLVAILLIIAIFSAMPFLRGFIPLDKVMRGLVLLWITMIPFQAVYVVFGGFLEPIGRAIPGWLGMLAMLVVYVPACVLVQRSRWYSAIYARLPARLRGFTATPRPATSPVQAAAGGLHGSAHWSTTQGGITGGRYQPANHVLADSHGFTLGRAPDAASNKALRDHDSRLRYMGHVLTVAPNGSGKGIGAVIPTLLDYPGSTIVLDVKGENYAVTARYRREKLGHEVFLLDPFGVIQQQQGTGAPTVPTHAFNWLDRLDPDSPDVVAESATLAEMLVVSESGHQSEGSAHFIETAKTFLRGLLVYVATLPEERRNMGEVRRLMTGGEAEFKELLVDMKTCSRGQDLPVRAVNSLLATPERERGSLLSTCRRYLDFLDDPRIVAALSRSDFSLDDLKHRPMTIYLVMPPARLSVNRAFVRAFFGQAINAVMAGAGKPAYRVLFLLDEFPQLGRMEIVEEKLPLIRGYGGAFWLVAQNLDQLKETYPRWQNFVANCGAKQFFGTADVETARYVSDSLGKMTVEYRTANASTSAGQSFSTGSGSAQQFTGRDLLTADEVMRLPREQEIVLITSEAPWMLTRLNYLCDPEYAGKFDANPYE